MNKTVIASFVALTLASSGAAFAKTVVHHKTVNDAALHARVTKAETILNQNSAVNVVSTHNWFNRIAVGGLINIDANWSDTFPGGSFFSKKDSSDINISNANLFVDANVNSWIKAHVNLAYLGDERDWTYRFPWIFNDTVGVREGDSRLAVDEAYVKIGNFARTPFYAIVGKQYVPFGTYDRYPLVLPFTQLLSQTRKTAINLGVVTDMGLYANLFVFNGGTTKSSKVDKDIENIGAKVGYFGTMKAHSGLAPAHYDVNVSVLRNIYDSDALAPLFYYGSVINTTVPAVPFSVTFGYPHTTAGLALHGDIAVGRFDASANFVSSLGQLKANFTVTPPSGIPFVTNLFSKTLWSADFNGGYRFMTFNRNSRVGISYQFTGGGNAFNPLMATISSVISTIGGYPVSGYSPIPKRRFMIDYRVHVWHMTDLAFALDRTDSYTNPLVGLGSRHAYEALARLSVRF